MGAIAKFDEIGAAMHHPNRVVIHSQLLSANLCEGRLHALAHRASTGHEFNATGDIDREVHAVGGTQARFLDKHGQTSNCRFGGVRRIQGFDA